MKNEMLLKVWCDIIRILCGEADACVVRLPVDPEVLLFREQRPAESENQKYKEKDTVFQKKVLDPSTLFIIVHVSAPSKQDREVLSSQQDDCLDM